MKCRMGHASLHTLSSTGAAIFESERPVNKANYTLYMRFYLVHAALDTIEHCIVHHHTKQVHSYDSHARQC